MELLVITGTMGAGKSTVLSEASDVLAKHHVVHAAIDLDVLGLAYLASADANDSVMYRNLQSVSANYASLGVTRILLARAIEDRSELDLCCKATSATSTVVCRLTASLKTLEQRVRARESGALQQKYVARVAQLGAILDGARLENFTITTENRSVTEAAREMLVKAGWISS
jgi:hypothetical protein